jgi:hypothetical protein
MELLRYRLSNLSSKWGALQLPSWFTLPWCYRWRNDGQVGYSRCLLLWIRLAKLHSSIVCITDLTPAELCLGYTLNRSGGKVAVQSRRIGTFLLHCLVSALYYLFLLLCTCFVLSYILLCFLSCLHVFPWCFYNFFLVSFIPFFIIFVPFPDTGFQLIVFVLGRFYFILDYLFLSVYYIFCTLSSCLTKVPPSCIYFFMFSSFNAY